MRKAAGLQLEPGLGQFRFHRLVQRGYAVVIKARGDGAEHRHLVRRLAEGLTIALYLLGYIALSIRAALAVELVDGDEIGEIEHVDFFELAGGAILGCHHVQRKVDERHDAGVALPDARRLDHDEVEARDLARRNHVGHAGRDFAARGTRRQRAHIEIGTLYGVHANAVAQQCAAAFAARRVDRHERDLETVVLVEP